MRVACPSCKEVIPSEDVNVARIVAKCRACGAVFSFENQLGPTPTPALSPIRVPVPMPAGITVSQDRPKSEGAYRSTASLGELTIKRRWFSPKAIFGVFFAVLWNGFLVVWYTSAARSGAPFIFFVFPLLHAAAGIYVAYSSVCDLFNETIIRIAGGRLTVRHGPIPARGARDLSVADVKQLYTEEIVSSKGVKTYAVHIVVTTGPTLTLVKSLDSAKQALFLEQTVEDHLQIDDTPVAGAFRG